MAYLKELELFGFKSFAGKVLFRFPDRRGVTTIVGPNGSGKSNIVDAIRFALGEQSPRALRIEDFGDVMHKGNGTGNASVTWAKLTIANESAEDDLPAEVVIERKVYAQVKESEYAINREPVRLKDIQLALAKMRIGTKGAAIVNQGSTDNFLKASPKERREILVDTMGLKELVLKRHEAVRTWLRTKENLKHIDIRLQEIAPQMKFFEKERQKLEKKQKVSQDIDALERIFSAGRLFALEKRERELSGALENLKKSQEVVQERLKESEEAIVQGSPSSAFQEILEALRGLLAVENIGEIKESIRALIQLIEGKVSQSSAGTPSRAQIAQTIREFKHGEEILYGATAEHAQVVRDINAIRAAVPEIEPVEYKNLSEIEMRLQNLRDDLDRIESVDADVLTEFAGVSHRGEELQKQKADLEKGLEDTKTLIKKLDRQIKKDFLRSLKLINVELHEYFSFIFGGGSAKLVPEPKTHDIFLKLDLPSKSIKNIEALSGGEKALAALSLMLAISRSVKPPFLILDEADAALDEANALKFASILKEVSKDVQVVVITHNRATIEASDYLYGVTSGKDNLSQVISMKLADAQAASAT